MAYTTVKLSRVLINSLPKSGTHLLAKAAEIFGYQEHFANSESAQAEPAQIDSDRKTPIFFNRREVLNALKKLNGQNLETRDQDQAQGQISIGALTPCYVSTAIVRHWLEMMAPGQYILGHIPWTSLLEPILAEVDVQHLFIIRDPRAVIASSIPFILDTGKMPSKHFLEDDFKQMSPDQRVDFILEGGFASQAGVDIKGFADVYRSMLSWRNDPNCCFVHFEDLVGEQGGGSVEQQTRVIEQISSHLGVPIDQHISTQLTTIYNPSARTFRSGKIDGWKRSLDSSIVDRLVEYCQPLCEEAGYE